MAIELDGIDAKTHIVIMGRNILRDNIQAKMSQKEFTSATARLGLPARPLTIRKIRVAVVSRLRQVGILFTPPALAYHSLAQASFVATPMEDLMKTADDLYDDGRYEEAYKLLEVHKESKNAEVLWRLGRLCYEIARPLKSESQQKPLHLEAYEYVRKALEIDEKNFAAHKWMFILLDKFAYYQGTKARLEKAYVTKEHIQRACELNPKDGTSWHLLAWWCFAVAEMPWYQRQIASAVFAAPPTSTFEEALKYFLEAENAEPNFYSTNLLMLGRTYLKLGNKEEAKKYLIRARDYQQKTFEDKKVRFHSPTSSLTFDSLTRTLAKKSRNIAVEGS